jgi:trimethylamine:corrinoid methyltransferase-like protein
MQPKVTLLTDELIQRIVKEAYQLMSKPGIKVQNAEARQLLAAAGAQVDEDAMVVKIPEQLASSFFMIMTATRRSSMEAMRFTSIPVLPASRCLILKHLNTRMQKRPT